MLLVAVMIASTFQIFALGVLASPIIEDLDISRTTLGIIGAVNTGVGALTAPFSGRLTDRIGPRSAVLIVLTLSAVGMVMMSLAHSPLVLLASGIVSGVPQGWGNPSTNALIASAVEPGQRGTLTGIKQSGVTFAILVAGLGLPAFERASSWQGACSVFAGLFIFLVIVAATALPRSAATGARADDEVAKPSPSEPLPPFIIRLGIFAFVMGLASGSIGRFLALFAEEALGYSLSTAGLAVGLSGLLGMGFRIAAARAAENRIPPPKLLVRLALVGVASSTLLALSTVVGAWLLWPAVVLYALGHTAWNAVANLTIIMTVPTHQAGRASGIIIFGFLLGLSLASPGTGAIVDATGNYAYAWWASAALAFGAAVLLSRSVGEPKAAT